MNVAELPDIQLAVLLGFDAFRLALGMKPVHFEPAIVVEGMRICADVVSRRSSEQRDE